jgi:hypothetical protein
LLTDFALVKTKVFYESSINSIKSETFSKESQLMNFNLKADFNSDLTSDFYSDSTSDFHLDFKQFKI